MTGRALISIIIVVIMISIIASCTPPSSDPLVQFEVPNEFRGFFVVVHGPGGANDGRGGDAVRVTVPSSRVAVLKDVSVLEEWHRVQANYRDGTKLPVRGFDGDYPGEVMLREVGAARFLENPERVIFVCFVGDEAALKAQLTQGKAIVARSILEANR